MSKTTKVAGAVVIILALIGLYLLADGVLSLITTNNPSRQVQAQCASLGGVYDGEACWYNGEKVDVNKYIEER